MSFRPTTEIARFLASPAGTAALVQAADLPLSSNTLLANLQTLRRRLAADQAAAVVEQVLLRRKGREKFPQAADMLFVREALEQATHHLVARHHARRYSGMPCVVDLGCGIGGDSLALAAVADFVLGVDLDPVRLQFADHNLAVYNRADQAAFVLADATHLPGNVRRFSAIFADPARRAGQRRTKNPDHYHPPLNQLMETYRRQALGIKVAPGLDFSTVPQSAEIELVSLAGELKEGMLWFNEPATPGVSRRATLLPGGETVTDQQEATLSITALGAYLYEPDPAIIRAGLVQQVAAELSLAFLDPHIAYLTGGQAVYSPLVKAYQVEAQLPLKVKAVNRYLKQHQIGRLNIKQRGTGLAPDAVARQLKSTKGGQEKTLILVRVGNDHQALICERL